MDFDQVTIEALNDVAVLLQVAQSLRGSRKAFRNHQEIDVGAAQKHRNIVLHQTRIVGGKMLKGAFMAREGKLTVEALNHIRDDVIARLRKAEKHALVLAQIWERAVTEPGVKGNLVWVTIHAPLQGLVARWEHSAALANSEVGS
jgi:hypothetical protein